MPLGQIRIFAGSYAPVGWSLCNGAQLSIKDNGELFKEIGTRYGGDGRTNFLLPDLRGRAPMHRADGAAVGTKGKFSAGAGNTSPHARIALNFIIAVQSTRVAESHDPYIGEIRPFGFNFAPRGRARCDGSLLQIAGDAETLFVVLENTFGGDGSRTFAVPDLSGAYPFQPDNPAQRGQTGGAQVLHNPSQQTPLLTLNYSIAVNGYYPERPN